MVQSLSGLCEALLGSIPNICLLGGRQREVWGSGKRPAHFCQVSVEGEWVACLSLKGILAELSRDCRNLCSVGPGIGALGVNGVCCLMYGRQLYEWDLSSGGGPAWNQCHQDPLCNSSQLEPTLTRSFLQSIQLCFPKEQESRTDRSPGCLGLKSVQEEAPSHSRLFVSYPSHMIQLICIPPVRSFMP